MLLSTQRAQLFALSSNPVLALAPKTLRHSRLQDILLWLLRRRRRFRVQGASMLPLLRPGEEVLIQPGAYRKRAPHPGDLIIAYHPQRSGFLLVKWVVFVEADGCCYLQGLNLIESTDSRQFGMVPQASLLGRVVCRFP